MTQPLRPIVFSLAIDGLAPAALDEAVEKLPGLPVTIRVGDLVAQGPCTAADVDVDGLLTIAVDKGEVLS